MSIAFAWTEKLYSQTENLKQACPDLSDEPDPSALYLLRVFVVDWCNLGPGDKNGNSMFIMERMKLPVTGF